MEKSNTQYVKNEATEDVYKRQDYIRTARAKGLTRMRVIIVHALRNAMLPVVTVIGLQVGTLPVSYTHLFRRCQLLHDLP